MDEEDADVISPPPALESDRGTSPSTSKALDGPKLLEMLVSKLSDAIDRLEDVVQEQQAATDRVLSHPAVTRKSGSSVSGVGSMDRLSRSQLEFGFLPEKFLQQESQQELPPSVGPIATNKSLKDVIKTGDDLAKVQPPFKLFADKDSLKEKFKQRMETFTDAERIRNAMYRNTGIPAAIVKREVFELSSLAVVFVNAMWIAVDLDVNGAATSPLESHPIALIVENLFCIYFLTEWGLKFAALKERLYFWKDYWLALDSILLAVMIAETWGLLLFYAIYPKRSPPRVLTAPQSLRALRILRITRVGRAMRLFRYAPELLYLVHGMISGIRSVAYSMALLLLMLYIFALLFRVTSEGSDFGAEYFPTVIQAVLSLGIYGALLDGPSELIQKMQDEGAAFNVVLFFIVIFLTALTLMNMLIGVLCDVVCTVSSAEREVADEHYMHGILFDVFNRMDDDKDSFITKDEFVKGLQNPKVVEALQELQVDIITLIDLADILFQSDEHFSGRNYDNVLNLNSFTMCIAQLRGDSPAKVRDVVEQRKLLHKQATETNSLIIGLASNQQHLEQYQIKQLKYLKNIDTRTYRSMNELTVQMKQMAASLEELPQVTPKHGNANSLIHCAPIADPQAAYSSTGGGNTNDIMLERKSDDAKSSSLEVSESHHTQVTDLVSLREQLAILTSRISTLEDRKNEDYEAGMMQGIRVHQEWAQEHGEATVLKRAYNDLSV